MSKRSKIIKKLKNSSAYKDAETWDYNDNDDVIIQIGLKNVEDFFNPYSYKDYELVNTELLDFIYTNEKTIPISESITLEINTECPVNKDDQQRIKETLKRQHAEDVIVVNKKLKQNFLSGIINFLLGVLILAGTLFLENNEFFMSNVLINTLMIIAWVFVWKAIEQLFIERVRLKNLLIRNYRLMNAKVNIQQYKKTVKTKKEKQ